LRQPPCRELQKLNASGASYQDEERTREGKERKEEEIIKRRMLRRNAEEECWLYL
jgi:hypothetical protein